MAKNIGNDKAIEYKGIYEQTKSMISAINNIDIATQNYESILSDIDKKYRKTNNY